MLWALYEGQYVPLTDENIFSRCPGCGCTYRVVDIVDALQGYEGTLYNYLQFCPQCAQEVMYG